MHSTVPGLTLTGWNHKLSTKIAWVRATQQNEGTHCYTCARYSLKDIALEHAEQKAMQEQSKRADWEAEEGCVCTVHVCVSGCRVLLVSWCITCDTIDTQTTKGNQNILRHTQESLRDYTQTNTFHPRALSLSLMHTLIICHRSHKVESQWVARKKERLSPCSCCGLILTPFRP